MMRTLIVYGNCQAEHAFQFLARLPAVTQRFALRRYVSFVQPSGTEVAEASPEDFSRCALLLAHPNDPARPYDESLLPKDCARLIFAPLDFNVLWPFHTKNLYNRTSVSRPWGSFPYGDRIIMESLEAGRSPADTLRYYLEAYEHYKPNVARLLALEEHRLRARDAACDLKLGEFVLGNFRSVNLFWARNHPTGVLMRVLIADIITALGSFVDGIGTVKPDDLAPYMPPEWPFGELQIPIHPRVAAELSLSWYDPATMYRLYNRTYSYAQYFAGLIEDTDAALKESARVADASKT